MNMESFIKDWSFSALLTLLTSIAGIILIVILVVFYSTRLRGIAKGAIPLYKDPKLSIAIIAVVALTIVTFISAFYSGKVTDIYRVRVTVVDSKGIPIEDAKVWSSLGGEPKKVAGGWQFDIPKVIKPQSGNIKLSASQESAFLTGNADLVLSNDYSPAVTIRLQRDDSAKVRGQVVDSKRRAVAGARVLIVGYESEAIITKEGGNFELPAHAAQNQQVLIQVEKSGYQSGRQWHLAGYHPALLLLER